MKKVIIIGGVAAGLKTASRLRRLDAEADITVIEKGQLISYGACGLPYFIGKKIEDITALMKTPAGALRDEHFFKNAKGFNVLTGVEAIKIDRTNKKVHAVKIATNEQLIFDYDKLVLATGASPVKPAIKGIQLKNVFTLWHPDDAAAIRHQLKNNEIKNAVIVGAGLVGMEMAEAFSNWNINVTVIEMQEQIFPAFLDKEIAASVAKYIVQQGIQLKLGHKVLEFAEKEGAVSEVITDKGTLPADIVVVAIGVKPNVELAKKAQLVIGSTGAIAVNERLETSDPDIYAGGDCAENINMITGKKVFAPMGSTANKHGRIIAENIAGLDSEFKGVLNTVIVKVKGMNVSKTGLTEREALEFGYDYITALSTGNDKPHYMPGSKPVTIKLIVDIPTKKILGAQVYGEGAVDKRADVIAAVITLGGTVDDLFDIDLAYAPPYSSPIDNVAVAANVVMNKLAGLMKGMSSLEAVNKLDNENVVFLDVRSPAECSELQISGCPTLINVPLGQLRQKLDKLPKEKEIITYCKISLRGYEAQRILDAAGFREVKVMEGGIVNWPLQCDKKL